MAANGKRAAKPDFTTLAGLVLGVGGILLGQRLEGGNPSQIFGLSAAVIVLGGTIGAVLVSTPFGTLKRAIVRLKDVLFEVPLDPEAMIDDVLDLAVKARKNGIVSLETEAAEIPNRFLRKALTLAVDGTDLQEIRKMMELEIIVAEQRAEAEAKVFESAGGYSPTIGIIGAVLGLILVMRDLGDMEKVGAGIASAFVATIYGVGFANLFCLPAGAKIKARMHQQTELNELILEGVSGIVEGLNPRILGAKLEAYSAGPPARKPDRRRPHSAADAAPARG
jgi:chemotaxis protein MotA